MAAAVEVEVELMVGISCLGCQGSGWRSAAAQCHYNTYTMEPSGREHSEGWGGSQASFSRGGARAWCHFSAFLQVGGMESRGWGTRLGGVSLSASTGVCRVAEPKQSCGGKDKVGEIWGPLTLALGYL